MLEEITSIADFYNKVESDERYKLAARKAHRNSENMCFEGTYEQAKRWIDDWIENNVQPKGRCQTCKDMVNFLNRFIRVC